MAITYSRSFGLKLSRAVGKDLQGLILMAFISALLLGGLGSRLAYLQLVEGARNQQLAGKNRIRLIPKPPQRGRILDRKGRTLAGSRLSYSVLVWPIALNTQSGPKPLSASPKFSRFRRLKFKRGWRGQNIPLLTCYGLPGDSALPR